MLPRLIRLLARRPELLADHAGAYAELASAEAAAALAHWQRRALFGLAALCALGLAAGLAGTALLLWAALPAATMPAAWLLPTVPLLPLPLALVCLRGALAGGDAAGFSGLRRQWQADLQLLRETAS